MTPETINLWTRIIAVCFILISILAAIRSPQRVIPLLFRVVVFTIPLLLIGGLVGLLLSMFLGRGGGGLGRTLLRGASWTWKAWTLLFSEQWAALCWAASRLTSAVRNRPRAKTVPDPITNQPGSDLATTPPEPGERL